MFRSTIEVDSLLHPVCAPCRTVCFPEVLLLAGRLVTARSLDLPGSTVAHCLCEVTFNQDFFVTR